MTGKRRANATNWRWQGARQRQPWQPGAGGEPRPPRAQTPAAGRFRGARGRWSPPRREAGARAGRGGARSVRAHLTLRRPGTPTRESGRQAGPRLPPPFLRTPGSPAGVCPTGVGPLLSALPGPRRQGLTTGPQRRTAWTRRLSRTRRQSKLLRATRGGAEEAPTAARGRRGPRRSRPLLARGAAAPARPGPPPPQRRARNEQAPAPGSRTEGPRRDFFPRRGAAGARSPRPGAAGSAAASSGEQAPGLTSAAAAASGRRSRAGAAAAPPLPLHTPGLLSGRPRRKFRSPPDPCASNSGGCEGAGIWGANALRAGRRGGSGGALPEAWSLGAVSGGAGVQDSLPAASPGAAASPSRRGGRPLSFPVGRLPRSPLFFHHRGEEVLESKHQRWLSAPSATPRIWSVSLWGGRLHWSISLGCRNGRPHLASFLQCCLPHLLLGMKRRLVITR
nr:translation initiation factor IF-2-like [Mirounga angustirostris]